MIQVMLHIIVEDSKYFAQKLSKKEGVEHDGLCNTREDG